MSSTIDNRVVEMSFDNKNFETNVKQSLGTIDKLNHSLKMTEQTNAFETIDKSARKLNLNGIAEAVDTVASRFSILGMIGMSVLQNLTNKAVDAGLRMASALSFDQIAAGWNKYAEKTSSVQTIMAATSSTWEEEAKNIGFAGSQMEYVEGQLEKLNWFTDETSYNFTDMVNNIGKFTSNGVALNNSVTAMQGIATWAAISGQNAQKASQAMYNISQAMGTGAMKVIDWKSIENANMATREFKEAALQAAEATGTLKKDLKATKKTGEDVWVTNVKGAKKATVTVNGFRDSLQKGWFTADVMMKVFEQYGGAADALYELSDAANYAFTTSEILDYVDAYQNGSKTIEQVSKETGIDIETLSKNFDYLTSEVGKFGLKTFKAAQEAKTFAEAIDATKDAVSTAWLRIFQDLFGNYEEAKTIWTGLANYLYEVFVTPLNTAHTILQEWKKEGGWAALFEEETGAFWRLGASLKEIVQPAKDAWAAIFPNTVNEEGGANVEWWTSKLLGLSNAINILVDRMKPSEKTAERMQRIFQGLFAIVDMGRNFFNALGRVLKEYLYPVFSRLFDKAFEGSATLGDLLVKLRDYTSENDTFYNALKKVAEIIKTGFEKAGDIIGKLHDKILDLTGIDLHVPTFEELANAWDKIKHAGETLKGVLEDLKTVWDNFLAGFKGEGQIVVIDENSEKLNKISTIFYKLGGAIGFLSDKLKLLGSAFSDKAKDIFNGKGINIGNVLKIAASITIFKKVFDFTKARFELKGIWKSIKDTFKGIPEVLEGVTGAFDAFKNNTNALAIKNLAIGIGILTASLIALSFVDGEKLAQSLGAISVVIAELVGAMAIMSTVLGGPIGGLLKASALKKTATALMEVGAAVLLFAVGIRIIGSLSPEQMSTGLTVLTEALIALGAAVFVLDKIGVKRIEGIGLSMITMAGALLIMAKAIEKMGSLKFETIAKGFIGVAASLLLLVAALAIMTKLGVTKIAGVGVAMAGMSAAMLVMAIAIERMAAIPKEEFISGILRVAAALGVLVIALTAMSGNNCLSGAAAILIVSVALLALQVALIKIGEMDGEAIAKALIAITVSLFAICGALALCESSIGGAASILIIAIALNALVPVIQSLGAMPFADVVTGLVALAGALGIVVLAGNLAQGAIGGLLALSAAMIAISLGIAIFVPSFEKLAALSWEQIAQGLTALAGAMAILVLSAAAAGALAPGFMVLSVAMIALGAASILVGAGMGLAVSAIERLCEIKNIEAVGSSMIDLGAGLGAIGVGGVAALLGVPGLMAVRDVISSMAKPCQTLSQTLPTTIDNLIRLSEVKKAIEGYKEVSSGLKEIGKAFKEFGKSTEDILSASVALAAVAPLLMMISTSCETMGVSMTQFNIAIKQIISIGDFFNQALLKITVGITSLTVALASMKNTGAVETLDKTATTMGTFANSASKLADGLGSSVSSMMTFVTLKEQLDAAIPGVKKQVTQLLNSVLSTIKQQNPNFKQAGITLMNQFGLGLESAKNTVISNAKNVASAAVEALRSKRNEAYNAGSYFAQGFADGIKSKKGSVESAAESIASAASAQIRHAAEIMSPSRVTMRLGAYFTQGFAIGIERAGKDVEQSTNDMLNGVFNVAQVLSDRIREKLEEESSPVITPVIDTSMIEAGTSRMSSYFGRMTIPTTMRRVGLAGSAFADASTIQNGSQESISSTNNYFTQNNYSPKSLSRIDIYRQTKNLFSAEKGAVKN